MRSRGWSESYFAAVENPDQLFCLQYWSCNCLIVPHSCVRLPLLVRSRSCEADFEKKSQKSKNISKVSNNIFRRKKTFFWPQDMFFEHFRSFRKNVFLTWKNIFGNQKIFFINMLKRSKNMFWDQKKKLFFSKKTKKYFQHF